MQANSIFRGSAPGDMEEDNTTERVGKPCGLSWSSRRQVFNNIEAKKRSAAFYVRAQFLEIYNEEVRDLLAPPPPPQQSEFCAGPGGGAGGSAGQQRVGGPRGAVGCNHGKL